MAKNFKYSHLARVSFITVHHKNLIHNEWEFNGRAYDQLVDFMELGYMQTSKGVVADKHIPSHEFVYFIKNKGKPLLYYTNLYM